MVAIKEGFLGFWMRVRVGEEEEGREGFCGERRKKRAKEASLNEKASVF